MTYYSQLHSSLKLATFTLPKVSASITAYAPKTSSTFVGGNPPSK